MIKKIGFILVCILLVFVYIYSMTIKNQQIKEVKRNYESIISYSDAEKNKLIKEDSLKAVEIKTMAQNQLSHSVAIEEFKKELNGFKRAQILVKSEILTEINGLSIGLEGDSSLSDLNLVDSMYLHKDTVLNNFIRIPKSGHYSDDWISMDFKIKKDFVLDSLRLINKFDIVIGYKKQDKSFGFLRKKDPVVEMKSYNPYSSVPYINNIVIKDDRKGLMKITSSKPAMFAYGFIASTVLNKL